MAARWDGTMARTLAATAIGLGGLALASSARAEPTANDRALATALFERARALVAAGNTAEACPMFEESQRLDPGAGTLLNLASCHEREGKLATASTEFNDALAEAERRGHADRVVYAKAHLAAIEPRLPRLVILVPSVVDRPDLTVTRDGTAVARVAWGLPMPVDPGAHEIAATAPGRAAWTRTVRIEAGERREVVVEPLVTVEAKPPPPRPAPPLAPLASLSRPPPAAPPPPPRAIAGIAVGAAGLAATAAGAIAGALAIARNARSVALCTPRCSEDGYALNQQAKTAADVSTVSFVTGAIAVGVGVALLVTSWPRRASGTAAIP